MFVLFLLAVSQAGKVCYSPGWDLTWSFPDDQKISFTLNFPETEYLYYKYTSVAFRYLDPQAIVDVTNILLFHDKNSGVFDNFSTFYPETPLDFVGGGKDHILEKSESTDGVTHTISWSKLQNTGDFFDVVFTPNQEYLFLYGYGFPKPANSTKVINIIDEWGNLFLDDAEYGCEVYSS
jgi:hypothetical protein